MNRGGHIRRLRAALDQLRLAVDYVTLAATTLLDALEAEESKGMEEEPTKPGKPSAKGPHPFEPGTGPRPWSMAGGPTCAVCGQFRGHPNHR